MATRHDTLSSIGLLILRIGVGAYMTTHGWGKLQMIIDGRFGELGDPLGLGSGLSLVLATGAEFFCAILVILGLFTRLAAAPIVFTMLIAAFVVHGSDPWTMQPEGASKEPALLFLIPMLALIFTGAGKFSLDAAIVPRLRARWNARRRAAKND